MTSPDKLAPVSEELLPCPFCGNEPRIIGPELGRYEVGCWGHWHLSHACKFGPAVAGATKAEAIAAWNRRTAPSTGEVTEALVANVVSLIRSAWRLCDDTEGTPIVGTDGVMTYTTPTEDWERLAAALDVLDELPNPPGVTAGPASKVEYALRGALAAVPVASGAEAAPASVEVKPLVWGFDPNLMAATPWGFYSIVTADDGTGRWDRWRWKYGGDESEATYASISGAKAAAQADYEARIRSALVNGGNP